MPLPHRGRCAPVWPFYSPLVVVAHRNAAGVLAGNAPARLRAHGGSKFTTRGTLLMDPYLTAAEDDRTWQQLKRASGHAELSGTVFITSTDPVTSNSGALYLAAASYVADGGRVATDAVDLPAAATERLAALTGLLDGLLDPGWASEALADDPEGVHVVARAVRRDVPESVDAYLRTRWWTRLAPGARAPEEELERQVALLHGEAQMLVDGLREAEELRQRSHTKYLEDRGGGGGGLRRTPPSDAGRPPEP
ncbi:hypothetical protein ACIQWZ_03440 [Streptomyces sp. NPDC098077]|uniref:hypothetical protein n=1 Tax=Streptomyces sp. NPDC098077 TaxID=3366093 RepID=UPI0038185615